MTEKTLLSFFSPKTKSRILAAESKHDIHKIEDKENEPEKPLFTSKIRKRKFEDELQDEPVELTPKVSKSILNDSNVKSLNSSINFDDFRLCPSEKSQIVESEQESKIDQPDELKPFGYPHNTYKFLADEWRRDKQGRLATHPDYDPTTLQLPVGFLSSKDITPAMKQWWKIKSDNFDAVLFFKLGKFYELFHMDADIGVKELGLTYMKGKYAHAGFPEMAFSTHASGLVEKGYKVARIEQTERPEDAKTRVKESGESASDMKLVKRDICNIMSPGTRLFDSFDLEVDMLSASQPSRSLGYGLLLAITENTKAAKSKNAIELGICILDSSTASFTLADFEDDRSLSKLRTCLAHFSLPVAEVIVSKSSLSTETVKKIEKCVSTAKFEYTNRPVLPENTLKELIGNSYFSHRSEIPKVLSDLTLPNNFEFTQLSLTAFGCILSTLKRHLIDKQVISSGTFQRYFSDAPEISLGSADQTHMIIDDNALRNLDIITNSEGYLGKYGTVLSLVDHCMTASGKRKIVNMVCHPLFQKNDIDERLDAVSDLLSLENQYLANIRTSLGEIPDLERILFRLSACKKLHEYSEHPQNRAVLFDEKYFNKKKVGDVISVLNGFEELFSIHSTLLSLNFKSALLNRILHSDDGIARERIDDIKRFFKEFNTSFDLVTAKSQSIIIPREGHIKEYDESLYRIKQIDLKLQNYLADLKAKLGSNSLKFWGSDRSRYQIEIPTTVSASQIPQDFEFKSQRRGFKRYSNSYCQHMLTELIDAERVKSSVLKDVYVLLIDKLLKHRLDLYKIIDKFALIDCLASFAFFSSGSITNGVLTRPIIVESSKQFINYQEGYHPCLSTVKSDLVSNDISIGSISGNESRTLLITGPNMGGKSTIMRQTAMIVILAQLGCYVPCLFCELTPFDRIFARLGASFDNPRRGESTFYVELSETVVIIRRATEKSLVLLDELGRGTSTHDGLAIAYSVLKYIAEKINCITFFSTHYHYIARDLQIANHLNIRLMFMRCLIDDESNDNENKNAITFLYKLKQGICPKSYGFYVARLAGMNEKIVLRGIEMAKKMERNSLLNELVQARRTNQNIDYISLCRKIAKL